MPTLRQVSVPAALLFALAACGGGDEMPASPRPTAPAAVPPLTPPAEEVTPPAPEPPLCAEEDVAGALAAVAGVTSVREDKCGAYVKAPARCFSVTFDQPLDHAPGSEGATFAQRVQLVHRGCDLPTTLMDNGYELPSVFYEMEPSMTFGTNTVIVEHRFQGRSLPGRTELRWPALSIENGAGDLHAIVGAFKKLYPARWVSTGASKGGVTAVYHRFLHPDDVDGTVAYVAPASLARRDERYQTYLASGVLPAACAAAVRAYQVGALGTRRPAFLAFLRDTYGAPAETAGYYLEGYMSSFDWGFWQYGGECTRVPGASATDAAHVAYFREVLEREGSPRRAPAPSSAELSNAALAYEWGWQQGFAAQVGAHVVPSLETTAVRDAESESLWSSIVPNVALPAYDGSLTRKARDWVRTTAERLVLVYGEYDPWTGGAFDAPTQASSGRFVVTRGTHGANLAELAAPERERALSAVSAMYGVPPKARVAALALQVRGAHDAVVRHEVSALSRLSTVRLP